MVFRRTSVFFQGEAIVETFEAVGEFVSYQPEWGTCGTGGFVTVAYHAEDRFLDAPGEHPIYGLDNYIPNNTGIPVLAKKWQE